MRERCTLIPVRPTMSAPAQRAKSIGSTFSSIRVTRVLGRGQCRQQGQAGDRQVGRLPEKWQRVFQPPKRDLETRVDDDDVGHRSSLLVARGDITPRRSQGRLFNPTSGPSARPDFCNPRERSAQKICFWSSLPASPCLVSAASFGHCLVRPFEFLRTRSASASYRQAGGFPDNLSHSITSTAQCPRSFHPTGTSSSASRPACRGLRWRSRRRTPRQSRRCSLPATRRGSG